MKLFSMAAALSLLIGGPATAAVVPASTYVMKAGASDLFERESAALMKTSANPEVRKFAMMMSTDYAKSTAMVKAAATNAKLRVPPPKLEPMQAENLTKLRAAKGEARDRLYIEQQQMAHGEALALQRSYAAEGDVASLKAVAAKIVPVVESHKAMIDAM